MADIPTELKEFISGCIHSVSELEILLLMRDQPGRDWDIQAIGKALAMQGPALERRLLTLKACGLLAAKEIGGLRHYRYTPAPAELEGLVDALAKWYSTHPVLVTTLIFSKSSDNIRSFADSFRFRKKEDK